ncbi:hypothetical protein THAOC_02445 [Thalassiosira oceanica]|uniref:Uncharacterized protein n=1 Tax=Thalassiosira oceanica TaxID=159749 RepID=K0TM25_THAOC|nr:hypothetical protein THAOC_02445 [Thalassiosira oceanica]|eukprot:EJK75821.1 hypothetical protein THAOC_02445 [Thalassiosira oceanica]
MPSTVNKVDDSGSVDVVDEATASGHYGSGDRAATSSASQPLASGQRRHHPLIDNASDYAMNCAFMLQARAVLRQATLTSLQQTLRKRVRRHIGELNQTQILGSSSTDELLNLDRKVMKITVRDLEQSHALASKIGAKWAEVLQREGYNDHAKILLGCIQSESFFEWEQCDDEKEEEAPPTAIFPLAAMNSLRRYDEQYDEQNRPASYLPALDCPKNKRISGNQLIERMDYMARTGQSDWHYGWDAIDEAARINRSRIDYKRVQMADHLGVTEDDEGDAKESGKKKRRRGWCKSVKFRDEESDDNLSSEDRRQGRSATDQLDSILKNGEQKSAALQNDDDLADDAPDLMILSDLGQDRGRQASSVEEESICWNAAKSSFSRDEKRNLVASFIHPPHSFECDRGELSQLSEQHMAVEEKLGGTICGGLKPIAIAHLWEKTRQPAAADQANESQGTLQAQDSNLVRKRKRDLSRATKERLGQRTFMKIQPHLSKFFKHTKLKWTEVEDRNFIDFDLGECTVELAESDRPGHEDQSKESHDDSEENRKKIMAFRSLEVCLTT